MIDRIQLTIPGDHRYISTLRLAVSAAVSVHDVTLEDMEDIKVAVSESALQILHHSPATLTLTLDIGQNELKATIFGEGPGSAEPGEAADLEMGRMILESLMDEVTLDTGRITFLKVMNYAG